MTENVDLYIERDALIRELCDVDNVDVIKKTRRALNRALTAVKRATTKKDDDDEEVEYISKEEQEELLLHAFTEMFRARKEGIQRKSLKELIDEL